MFLITERTFYVELQPVNEYKLSKALDISGLDWENLLKLTGFPQKKQWHSLPTG